MGGFPAESLLSKTAARCTRASNSGYRARYGNDGQTYSVSRTSGARTRPKSGLGGCGLSFRSHRSGSRAASRRTARVPNPSRAIFSSCSIPQAGKTPADGADGADGVDGRGCVASASATHPSTSVAEAGGCIPPMSPGESRPSRATGASPPNETPPVCSGRV